MSIPRRDPKFTAAQHEKAAQKFVDAGYEYWEACHKIGIADGAVVWVKNINGQTAIFSRGEYVQKILQAIENQGPTHYFGAMKDD